MKKEDEKMGHNWIPAIEVESAHGVREVALATKHFMNRNVFLQGEIDMEMADRFLSQMLYLENEAHDPVTIYIDSYGGEVNSGLMIYDIMQASSLDITVICTGVAASMAAILMAGGRKGKRFILPHSKVMIHEPLISSGVGGSATSIKNISESILETRDIVNGILAKHTGKSLEEINNATSYDNYMNAEEAVKFGICDGIINRLSAYGAKAAN